VAASTAIIGNPSPPAVDVPVPSAASSPLPHAPRAPQAPSNTGDKTAPSAPSCSGSSPENSRGAPSCADPPKRFVCPPIKIPADRRGSGHPFIADFYSGELLGPAKIPNRFHRPGNTNLLTEGRDGLQFFGVKSGCAHAACLCSRSGPLTFFATIARRLFR
jgi:hypothetical protein